MQEMSASSDAAPPVHRRLLGAGVAAAALAFVGWLDHVTGPLVAVSPFYLLVLVPLAVRNRWPPAIAYAAVAAAVSLGVDLLTSPDLGWTIYPYWRAIAQLLSFSLVSFTIPRLMEERARLSRSQAALTRQRAELHELNRKLLAAVEDLGARRERFVEDLVRQHAHEVRELREMLERVFGEPDGPQRLRT
jgi:hypothetical protein